MFTLTKDTDILPAGSKEVAPLEHTIKAVTTDVPAGNMSDLYTQNECTIEFVGNNAIVAVHSKT